MGKAIVYCQDCGLSLHEADFEKGKASRIDNRPYCAKCRKPEAKPSPPPPSTPPRRGMTDRVPVLRPPPATPRAPFKPTETRAPVWLWMSLGAAGLFLLILVWAFSSEKPAPPAPPTPPAPPRPIVHDPRPAPPRPGPTQLERDVEVLKGLLAGQPAFWKREEIEALLARRPELEGQRRDYRKGLLSLRLLDGLVAHWPLDGDARDATGRGHDGKILGAPERVAGKIGGAFHFRGNDEDGVEIGANNELDTMESKSYSLCLWFKPDQVPAGREVKSNDSWYALLTRPGLHLGLAYSRQGKAEMTHYLDGQKQAHHVSNDAIAANVWTHVVGEVDAVEGRTRVYVNGRFSGEASWTPRTKAHRLTSPWRIGVAAPKATEWSWSMKGAIDDVRFYARSLPADEIALLAEATPLPTEPPRARPPSSDDLILSLKSDVGVSASNGFVDTWKDVDRDVVTHAENDERPAWKDGAVVLDGKNDRVVFHGIPDHAFKAEDSFTLLAKVRVDAVAKGRWSALFAKSMSPAPWYGIWTDGEGRWVFGNPDHNLHGSAVRTGVTTVVAVQAGGQERRLYVDGVRVATGPAVAGNGGGDLWIGGAKGRGEYFAGALLEIKLWRRALAPDEVIAK